MSRAPRPHSRPAAALLVAGCLWSGAVSAGPAEPNGPAGAGPAGSADAGPAGSTGPANQEPARTARAPLSLPAFALSDETAPTETAVTAEPIPDGGAPVAMTLEDALRRARATSPTLGRMEALQVAAGARTRAAFAQRMPLVDLSADYTRRSHVPELVVPVPGAPGPGGVPTFTAETIFPDIPDTFHSRLGIHLPLYSSGRLTKGVAAAEAEQAAAGDDLSAAQSDLDRETTQTFWDLVAAREDERTLREALAAYDAHLVQARDREAAGLAARNEVLAVQVERDRAELGRLQAGAGAEISAAALGRLTGLPAGAAIEPIPPEETASDGDSPTPGVSGDRPLEELLAAAFAARPERAALRARAEAASARAKSIRGGRGPQASLDAGYDYSNPNRQILPLTDAWESTWDIGVGFSLSVFDGGRIAASAAVVDAQAEALRRQAEELDLAIRLEIATRAAEWRTARAALALARSTIESARENQRVAGDRYREGLIPSAELLDAETDLLRAGLQRTRAVAGLQIAAANLRRAVGTAEPSAQ